jgi:hypothetical protein
MNAQKSSESKTTPDNSVNHPITKEQIKTKIIQELTEHYLLLKSIYGPDVDICEKLINLVHQIPLEAIQDQSK